MFRLRPDNCRDKERVAHVRADAAGSLHVIEGEVDDYLEAANDLLGSQFLFNRMAAAS